MSVSPAEIERAHRHADDAFVCAEKAEKLALNGLPGKAAQSATQAVHHYFICRRSGVGDAARRAGRRASAACDAVKMAYELAANGQMAEHWERTATQISMEVERYYGDQESRR